MGRIVCDSGSCGAIGLVSQQIAYFTGGAGYVMNQSAPLSTWHQVVFTLDNSGNATFYLDGTPVAGSGSAPASQPLDFCIGAATANGRGSGGDFYVWNGLIDDVRVYNRNLSASEVQQLYQYEANPGTPPSLTNQPLSQTVPVGSNASFSVTPSGGPSFSYQWQFDGTNLSDGTNITGSSSSALTLEDVTTNQVGSYTVVITNVFHCHPVLASAAGCKWLNVNAMRIKDDVSDSEFVLAFAPAPAMPDWLHARWKIDFFATDRLDLPGAISPLCQSLPWKLQDL